MPIDVPWPPRAPSLPAVVTRSAVHLLAPNATAWTYEGTNSWLLGIPGRSGCLVVDPGTQEPRHLDAILTTARSRGWTVAGILVTHNHDDHAPGAPELRRATGAPVYAYDAAIADVVLADGDRIRVEGLDVEVLHTPGHSADSVSFWLPRERSVLTGDTILGRRASALFGSLADFLTSADRLRALSREEPVTLLPGHGPPLPDATAVIDRVVEVRHRRLDEVARLVEAGVTEIGPLTDTIYPGVDDLRRPAAEHAVRAALDHLIGAPVAPVHQH
ncbi:MBL fold metallo-hydrolase [Nocardioides sp. DS6]|uniref:MBL fold metallo-hydrolase n=1 Tax=Nocardioides eburneus TaxID=3231482 RepID=A0ABV3SY03_9ACTN